MLRRTLEGDRLIHWLIKQLVTMAVLTTTVASAQQSTISVNDVEQLYAAVNDPTNAGATVVLAPGTYVLSGVARPNDGRLELQHNMSLQGVEGDPGLVQIDGSQLTAFSFPPGSFKGKTGVIRVGRGTNAIEWLTVVGNDKAAATIDTDLIDTDRPDAYSEPVTALIIIAHVVAAGGGLDIRNAGGDAAHVMDGRQLTAVVSDNQFSGGVFGIRIANHVSVTGGQVDVSMRGNLWHDNTLGWGCLVLDLNSHSSTIHVRSEGDRFEYNQIGCAIYGGRTTMETSTANENAVTFDAHGSAFQHNAAGGVLIAGGDAVVQANSASDNNVAVALWGCKVDDNPSYEIRAYGAFMEALSGIAGTDNTVTIALHGVSKQIDVDAAASVPDDPTGTNTVTVIR